MEFPHCFYKWKNLLKIAEIILVEILAISFGHDIRALMIAEFLSYEEKYLKRQWEPFWNLKRSKSCVQCVSFYNRPLLVPARRHSSFLIGPATMLCVAIYFGTRAYLFSPDERSCYVFSIWNNCCEFLAFDGVIL